MAHKDTQDIYVVERKQVGLGGRTKFAFIESTTTGGKLLHICAACQHNDRS